nr:MAG: AdoMet dependent proline di-methyltransferase [Bacteriophage sp.]
MRYISLFSGIEAASVAWAPLGWEPLAFAEIEPFCCELLEKRFPGVPNLRDVCGVDWSAYRGKCDLIIGGSPCQAFSVAGRREGLDDPRGRLMLEYARAVREVEPRWVLWENVPGVLSAAAPHERGRAVLRFDEGGCREYARHASEEADPDRV